MLEEKKHPWIILSLEFSDLGYNLGDITSYVPNADFAQVKSLLKDEYKPWFSIPFLKYFGRFENYLRPYTDEHVDFITESDKGAVTYKNELPPVEFKKLVAERKKTTTVFKCDTLLKAKLFQIIDSNPTRKFLFVVAPYHNSYFCKFLNPEVAGRFIDLLRTQNNVKVLDFSKMPLADSMFTNTSHLNFSGAVAFSQILRDSLKSAGVN